jgi:hypothetical protein
LENLAALGQLRSADIQALVDDTASPLNVRLDAITILLALQEPRTELLDRLLNCDDRTIFIETVKSARSLGVAWALPYLVVGIGAEKDPEKRAILAWALAAFSAYPGVEGTLLDASVNDNASIVREHAIESLGVFRSTRVTEALVHFLEEGSPSERFWALYSLGNLADESATQAIRLCLRDQTEIPRLGTIADEAEWALTRINERQREKDEQ